VRYQMWVTPVITSSSSGRRMSKSQPLLKAGPESHGSHRITTSPSAILHAGMIDQSDLHRFQEQAHGPSSL